MDANVPHRFLRQQPDVFEPFRATWILRSKQALEILHDSMKP